MKIRNSALLLALSAAGSTALLSTAAFASPSDPGTGKPTVVLVHGAFADSSGWDGVVKKLQKDGYPVVAPANPLRGLAGDSSYVSSVLSSIEGPVVLVGHSYGGEVITNAAVDHPNVKALVYIAAIAPEKGESANDILSKYDGSKLPESLKPIPYNRPDGTQGTDLYISPDKFRSVFAADVKAKEAAVMAATQRPIDGNSLSDKSENAAWKNIPSWYMVAKGDQAIPPAAERFMADRAGATTVEVDASHAVAVSHPDDVSKLIVSAAKAKSTTG
ncbi:alpha/beta hydrolase [Kitasatospora sp. NPDC048540]|uniref:alpha/beta fold hydrolase n=1 Tax=unclassified Kitasatospora TaxID=2633591 RepID=UPI00053A6C42|nr:alpha/beta hydrolase [Kitasatospora sp. MBT63]